MQNIFQKEFRSIRMNNRGTSVLDSQTWTITYTNYIIAFKRLWVGDIFTLWGNMGICAIVSKPILVLIFCICLCNQSSQLGGWIESLVRVIHPVIAVKSTVVVLATYLTWRTCGWWIMEELVADFDGILGDMILWCCKWAVILWLGIGVKPWLLKCVGRHRWKGGSLCLVGIQEANNPDSGKSHLMLVFKQNFVTE